jgi:hypothetical protein
LAQLNLPGRPPAVSLLRTMPPSSEAGFSTGA